MDGFFLMQHSTFAVNFFNFSKFLRLNSFDMSKKLLQFTACSMTSSIGLQNNEVKNQISLRIERTEWHKIIERTQSSRFKMAKSADEPEFAVSIAKNNRNPSRYTLRHLRAIRR